MDDSYFIQKAVELGYDDVEWLQTDDGMDHLRDEKGFIGIIKKLEEENN